MPPLLLFSAAVFNHITIGVRHVLVIYPFLFIWGGFAIQFILEKAKRPAVQWIARVALLALFICFSVRTTSAAPDYLSYFNEAVGGVDNGAKLVADSKKLSSPKFLSINS